MVVDFEVTAMTAAGPIRDLLPVGRHLFEVPDEEDAGAGDTRVHAAGAVAERHAVGHITDAYA